MPIILLRPYSSEALEDTQIQFVSSLLHMDGADQSAVFIDERGNVVTAMGNVFIDTSVSKFGGASAKFDGQSYLFSNTEAASFGTNDFTVECWVNPSSRTSAFPTIFNNYNRWTSGAIGLFAGHASGNANLYQVSLNGYGFPNMQSSSAIVYDQWTHIAVERVNGIVTLYINGVAEASVNMNVPLGGAGALWIGSAGDEIANGYFNGHIDEFRITKGVARYFGNFTPPTMAFSSV